MGGSITETTQARVRNTQDDQAETHSGSRAQNACPIISARAKAPASSSEG